jgi:hypothetical protein
LSPHARAPFRRSNDDGILGHFTRIREDKKQKLLVCPGQSFPSARRPNTLRACRWRI